MYIREYISIIYTPSLGFEIADFCAEKAHSRFGGSTEGAMSAQQGIMGEHRGSRESREGSRERAQREQWGRSTKSLN